MQTMMGMDDSNTPFAVALSISKEAGVMVMLSTWDWQGRTCLGSLECRAWGLVPLGLPPSSVYQLVVDDLFGAHGDEVVFSSSLGRARQALIVPMGQDGSALDRVSESYDGIGLYAGRTELGAGVLAASWDVLTSRPTSKADQEAWPPELSRFDMVLYVHIWDGSELRFMGVAPDTAAALRQTKEEFVSLTTGKWGAEDWTPEDASKLYDQLWQGTYQVPLFSGIPDRSRHTAGDLVYTPGLPEG